METIQFFLRIYPTPNVIRDAVAELHNIRQLSKEEETDYSGRLSIALSRCGNVHDGPTIMTMLVNWLPPSIPTTITLILEENHRDEINFARLTQNF